MMALADCRIAFAFLLFTLLTAVNSVAPPKDDCRQHNSCDACIKSSEKCYWYGGVGDDWTRDNERCSKFTRDFLPDYPIYNVQSFIEQRSDLYKACVYYSGIGGSKRCEKSMKKYLTQSEREISIKLRENEEFVFSVPVQPNKRIPFQLYFLFDSSRSMKRCWDGNKAALKQAAHFIRSQWTGSQIGFGTLGDKETTPFTYVNRTKDGLLKNIPYFDPAFWTLYSEENPMLGLSATGFDRTVDTLNIEETDQDLDTDPEAQLDVMLQVLLCKEELGFFDRSNTRQVLFMITDSPFWAAGDGKFGAIIEPTTNECRGTTTEEQSEASIRYDYPSVGFFTAIAKQTGVYIVASVNNDAYTSPDRPVKSYASINEKVYSRLAEKLDGLGEYVPYNYNSDSLTKCDPKFSKVDSMKKALKEMTERVSLVVSGDVEGLEAKTFIQTGDCPPYSTELLNSKKEIIACNNVSDNDVVRVHVSIKRRPGNYSNITRKLHLNLPGVHMARPLYTLYVNPLNVSCDCEENDRNMLTDELHKCWGNMTCGACVCPEGFGGTLCDCDLVENSTLNNQSCIGSIDPHVECTGRGKCHCGVCMCEKNLFGNLYVGPHCECDPNTCPRGTNGLTCSGKGECQCDSKTGRMFCECVERRLWNRTENCECMNTDVCIDPSSGDKTVCNGRAIECTCNGTCLCDNGFSGRFCGNCTNDECRKALKREAYCKAHPDSKSCLSGQFPYDASARRLYDGSGNCKNVYYTENPDEPEIVMENITICEGDSTWVWVTSIIVSLQVLAAGVAIVAFWKRSVMNSDAAEKDNLISRNK